MASLQIKTGLISLEILDDRGDLRGVFKFNPRDISVAKKLIDLQEEIKQKEKEWMNKATQLDTTEDIEPKVQFVHSIIEYIRNSIDSLYGAGTSQILFGNAETVEMFDQFFEGIMPYYQQASQDRVNKHLSRYMS